MRAQARPGGPRCEIWADATARRYMYAMDIALCVHCACHAGDAGAALLLTTIQAKPEVWSLSVTRFVSRPIMMQLIEQLAANAKLHKVKGSTGRRTKKKTVT